MTLRFSSRRVAAPVPASLREAHGDVRWWSDGEQTLLHEGVAAMAEAHGPRRCRHLIEAVHAVEVSHEGPGPGPLWMGGLAFDEAHEPDGPWRGFPAASFCLPVRQVVWRNGEAIETVVVDAAQVPAVPPRAEAREGVAPDRPRAGRSAGGTTDTPKSGTAHPFLQATLPDWQTLVAAAQQEIHAGALTKVVAARVERLPVTEPREHVLHLSDDGIRFLIEADAASFYGCTPETLVRLEGDRVATHALAGSASADGDEAGLLSSGKDILEHELVTASVRERLVAAGVQKVQQASRRVRRLRDVMHLETPIAGTAARGTHLLDLAASLHPTPAVCGTPRRRSMQWIRDHEGWPRGWYAGAVGWFDTRGQGTLAVALRCALQEDGVRHAFAGAGIVAGSEADAEWAETEAKLHAMRGGA